MISAPQELMDLCLAVELADKGEPLEKHPMTPAVAALAPSLYAEAVNFCAKADLPTTAIRVEMASHGSVRKLWKTIANDATALRWDGREWVATREIRNGSRGFYGKCWLELDSRPAKMFLAKKRRKQEVYVVEIDSLWEVEGEAASEPIHISFNPWAKRETPPQTAGTAAATIILSTMERLGLLGQEGLSRDTNWNATLAQRRTQSLGLAGGMAGNAYVMGVKKK